MHFQLSIGNRLAQQSLQLHPIAGVLRHLRGIEVVCVAADFFGLVHGGVGSAQQVVGVFTVVGVQADTNAGRNQNLVAPQIERLGHAGNQLVCHQRSLLGRFQVFQNTNELVAPQARQQVAVAQVAAKPL